MPFEVNWTFPCRVQRVVDGDTLDVVIDVGFHSSRVERIRLMRPDGGFIDTPEVFGSEKEAGRLATRFVMEWVAEANGGLNGWPFIITTRKTDVFGRYLGDLRRVADGTSLADALLAAGLAVDRKEGTHG